MIDKKFLEGFRPEPPNPAHWSFEDKLKPRLVTGISTGNVDLRGFSSPRHSQGWTSSCVANAVVKALEIKRIMQFGRAAHVDLSRMAVYYLARELMFPKETGVDKGTFVSHACDVLRRWGVCPEEVWPFDPVKVCVPPSWMAMKSAHVNRITAFYKIGSSGDDLVEDIVKCLQAGNPVVFGTAIGQEWFGYRKGQVLNIPSKTEGRHATCLIGFKDGKFIGENSWGPAWGDDGFYLMDPGYVKWRQSSDFWTITAPWQEVK